MAEQTAIGYDSLEWKDDAAGGTPIEAPALNRMEQGIADACAGVDQLRTKRLPTYVVAQDGETATQDVYAEPILGPCLILDLATRTTYYETGTDEEGHRKAITSGADIDDLRDSLSRTTKVGSKTKQAEIFCDYDYSQRVSVRVVSQEGDDYMLVASDDRIGLYNRTSKSWVGSIDW